MSDFLALGIAAAVFAAVWYAVHRVKRDSPDGTFTGGVRRIFRLK